MDFRSFFMEGDIGKRYEIRDGNGHCLHHNIDIFTVKEKLIELESTVEPELFINYIVLKKNLEGKMNSAKPKTIIMQMDTFDLLIAFKRDAQDYLRAEIIKNMNNPTSNNMKTLIYRYSKIEKMIKNVEHLIDEMDAIQDERDKE